MDIGLAWGDDDDHFSFASDEWIGHEKSHKKHPIYLSQTQSPEEQLMKC